MQLFVILYSKVELSVVLILLYCSPRGEPVECSIYGINYLFQGGTVIRAARRMVERVGYDPDTGLHLEREPDPIGSPVILEDSKLST